MNERDEYEMWSRQILAISEENVDESMGTASETLAIADAVTVSSLPGEAKSALLFMCSSVVLNCAFELHQSGAIEQGRDLAERALEGITSREPLHYQCMYNVANATNALCELGFPDVVSGTPRAEWEPALIDNRIETRVELRDVRRAFFEVGSSTRADAHTRSAAFCNLANALDHSGRWAEAYDFYLRALEADPQNGNAAGNLAQLLRERIRTGIGQTGHIAAVYDKYALLAKQLRGGTLEYATATVADRWDTLLPTGSEGHLSHGLNDVEVVDRDYRRWVAELRLALSPAVEGLGTEDERWDSASIQVLYGANREDMNPPILAAMNVLKSDFLVSRRLCFEAIVQLLEGEEQPGSDSGFYTDTFDHSLYGVQYSKLLLAQRSALDVLDKTAVVANEHFEVGDVPRKVTFRSFWTSTEGQLREQMVKAPGRSLPNLALAELASDMDKNGMYSASQALRNAGTHRIVHAALSDTTGVTEDSRSKIDLSELIDSTVLALQVTRSAYLYLVDLVAMWNHPDDHTGNYLSFDSN